MREGGVALLVSSKVRAIQIFLIFTLVVNFLFWLWVRDMRVSWNNVPPAPDVKYAPLYGLGDSSLAYRLNALTIQNLGDTGGRTTSLKDYNYERLTKWFYLQDALDPISDFIPYLASYYFGGVQEPEKLRPVLDYLSDIGNRSYGEKWRWLAQGVFLARYKLKDLDRALEMAEILAATENENAPEWVRQMPAFIMSAKGEKNAAYALMLEILKTRGDKLHPNEVNAMKDYICKRILDKQDADQNPLCGGL